MSKQNAVFFLGGCLKPEKSLRNYLMGIKYIGIPVSWKERRRNTKENKERSEKQLARTVKHKEENLTSAFKGYCHVS